MITRIAKRLSKGRAVRTIPLYKVITAAEMALLAKRHFDRLGPGEVRRLGELVRRSRSLTTAEKAELRTLTAKLEPRLFLGTVADQLSPVPLPKRLTGLPTRKQQRAARKAPPAPSFRKR